MGQVYGKDGSGVGGRDRQTLWEREATELGARLNTTYEVHRFQVPGLADKWSLATLDHAASCTCARASGAFGKITRAAQVVVRNNDADVELLVRFNTATDDPVPLPAGDDMFWTFVEVTAVLFSNPNSALAKTVTVALG